MRKALRNTIPGSKCNYCDEEVVCRGLCWLHYERQRWGRPMDAPVLRRKECDLPFCKTKTTVRYCTYHRLRAEVWGNPLADAPATKKAEREFWAQASVAGASVCWPWNGPVHDPKNPRGQRYPVVLRHGERVAWARHVAYWLGHGKPVPDGMRVFLICKNGLCINPAHLKAAGKAEVLRQ